MILSSDLIIDELVKIHGEPLEMEAYRGALRELRNLIRAEFHLLVTLDMIQAENALIGIDRQEY